MRLAPVRGALSDLYRYRGLVRLLIARDLTVRPPDIVCLTQRAVSLLHDTPAMDTLQRTYALRRSFAHYGQFDESLYVLQRRR